MSDYIVRATAGNGSIRAFAATTRDLVQHAREIHHTSPVASAALGRMLTAAAMMGSMLKGEKDIVTLQIRGEGPLQGLVVTSDSHARVKGYVFNPNVEIPDLYPGKLNVGGAIGNGYMSVIKDIGMREPYAGRIELVTGEIADDLTYYFAQSEQTPSAVGLGVLVETDTSIRRAGGFIIQLLPDATDEKEAGNTSLCFGFTGYGENTGGYFADDSGRYGAENHGYRSDGILLQLHTRACGKGTHQHWQRGTGKNHQRGQEGKPALSFLRQGIRFYGRRTEKASGRCEMRE